MNINKAFPSTYLKASDLDGRTPVVTIKDVKLETIGDESKLVAYFAGKDKGLVLNRTNANTIADLTGSEDTDEWMGRSIKLITAKVEFQGRRVPAIRIQEAENDQPLQKTQTRQTPPAVEAPDESDIPF